MYKGVRIAAVVPAYREERMIASVITTMPEWVDIIVVVDDCSPDGTSDAVRAVGDDRVVLVRHDQNKGVGGAIVTGHRLAINAGAEVNVVMAGDGQMDPQYLPDLLEPVVAGGYGFAKANRFFRRDSYTGMPKHRILGNVVLSFMTKAASGYWHLFDPQNGYTAVRTSVLAKVDLDALAERYSFENDMLVHLNIAEVPAIDVPVPAVYGNEVSSIKLHRVVPELLHLFFRRYWYRVWFRYILWSFSPVALLLIAGMALSMLGVALGIWMVAVTWGATASPSAGTVLLAVTPFIVGIQMLVSSLQLDIQESPRQPVLPPLATE